MIGKIIGKIQRMLNYTKYLRNKGVKIGNNCEIYKTASFGSEPYLITLGDHVRVNSGVNFVTHDGGVWVLRGLATGVEDGFPQEFKNADLFGPITVGNNVHIGTNSIIMPGVNIGNNCIIGCGAVVTKNIPDNSVAVGVPARVIKTVDEYASKNESRFDYVKQYGYQEKKNYLLKKYDM